MNNTIKIKVCSILGYKVMKVSNWINVTKINSSEDLRKILTKQGFCSIDFDADLCIYSIDGDIEMAPFQRHIHPLNFCLALKNAGVFEDDYKFKRMQEFIAENGYLAFEYFTSLYKDLWFKDLDIEKTIEQY